MPYSFPATVHVRRHGPAGYTDYRSYKPWLRDEFAFRCVYCLQRERWYPNGQDAFSVEHAQPQHLAPDLVTTYDNLLYACVRCNSWKKLAELLDPTKEVMARHVRIEDDGQITALTDEGRRLVRVLHLDGDDETKWRCKMLDLLRRALAEWPRSSDLLRQWFGFPDDLPDLAGLRAPRNTRPYGVGNSHNELRQRGALPELSAMNLPSSAPAPPARR